MLNRRECLFMLFVGFVLAAATNATAQGNAFVAHLSGDEEVPSVETSAQGQFVLRSRVDLEYKLIVANIEDVFASHIHCAPPGTNGPVGLTLFSGAPVTVNGILAEGPILGPDQGNACGWENIDDLLAAIAAGNTYVNVHTESWPAGEIRGQIR